MSVDLGPASNTGVLFAGQTSSIEVHVGNPPSVNLGNIQTGLDPLPPSAAPYIDPGQVGTNITGNAVVPINKTIVFTGAPGTTQTIANPA